MTKQTTRRDILKGSLAVAGLGVLGIPECAFPALAQSEALVPFTDMPDNVVLVTGPDRRIIDIRKIDGPFTPKDQFFTTQHYGHPEVDPVAFRLKVSGLVDRPVSRRIWSPGSSARATVVRSRGSPETDAGPECRSTRCSIRLA